PPCADPREHRRLRLLPRAGRGRGDLGARPRRGRLPRLGRLRSLTRACSSCASGLARMMLGGDASRLAPVSELAQMRVSHLKANLESLDDLGAEHAARVRAEAAGIVSAIQAAVSVAWLPIELDVELTDAVERVAGRARMREWSRNAIVRSTEGPLLRPMLSALTRMGMTPHSAFKRVPYGWSLIYRGCGDLSYEAVGPKEVLIIQRDAPRAILD